MEKNYIHSAFHGLQHSVLLNVCCMASTSISGPGEILRERLPWLGNGQECSSSAMPDIEQWLAINGGAQADEVAVDECSKFILE